MSAIGTLFCKSRRSRCVFPFEFEGVKYEECAKRDVDGFAWCATAVNDQGTVVDGYWARCDLESCTEGKLEGVFNIERLILKSSGAC